MNPDINFEVSPELPQPQDDGMSVTSSESHPAAVPEVQVGASSAHADPAAASTQTQGADNPVAPATVPASGIAPAGNSQFTQHLIADDTDLIEKEWVLKAKAIVMHTKDDPHRQNQEVTKVKADYLKKRYNKDLKVNEG